MRYLIFFACLAVAQVMAQEQPIQMKKGEKKEKEEAQQKPPANIDVAAFQRSLAPIDEKILENNLTYVEKVRAEKLEKSETVLEGIEITQRTDIKIADDADAMVVLNPIDPMNAKLSYYGTAAKLLWQKNINLSNAGVDLTKGKVWSDISSNGKTLVIYGLQDEGATIIGVYDEKGNLIADSAPFAHFAPSGNFLYGYDAMYHDPELKIYDSRTFQPVQVNTEFYPPRQKNQRVFASRIFENDILVVVMIETQEKHVNKKDLYVYDLRNRRVVSHHNLMLENGKSLDLELGLADLKGSQFVCRLNNSLLNIDLESGKSTIQPVERLGSIRLSEDGTLLFMFHGSKSAQKSSIIDLMTNKMLFSGVLNLPRLEIQSFSIQGNALKILCYSSWKTNLGPALFSFSLDGTKQDSVEGWFNLRQGKKLIPVRNPKDPTTTVISISN